MSGTRAWWSRLAPHWPRRPERAPELSPAAELGSLLRAFRAAALWGVAALIATATGSAFTESYRGLFEWAEHHGFSGFWAAAFPLQVDLFIAVGELVLLVAMLDAWRRRDQAGAWLVALAGLAVSVAGNVGHIAAHDLQSRGTAAVPPVAAFGALWLGLGVLKRILRRRRGQAVTAAQSAHAADGRDALARVLDELTGAVLLLAAKGDAGPLPAAPDHSALLAELTATVKMLAGRPDGAVPPAVPDSAESAALASYRATALAGNPWSQRQLETRFGLTRTQGARVRDEVAAGLSRDGGPGTPGAIRYMELSGAGASA
jgi:hypothetical protein